MLVGFIYGLRAEASVAYVKPERGTVEQDFRLSRASLKVPCLFWRPSAWKAHCGIEAVVAAQPLTRNGRYGCES